MTALPRLRSRRLPIRSAAWTLSVMAHAAILTGLISHPNRHDGPASMSRRVGALQVRLNAHPQDVVRQVDSEFRPQRAAAPVNTASISNMGRDRRRPYSPASLPQPMPIAAAEAASPASTPESSPAASAAAPPPAASAPGASFANLFAPIISRPMGRGRWGAPPPSAPPPPSQDVLRQQAVQARRDQLTQSIQWLQTQLDRVPLAGTCQVQITLSQSAGAVICQDPVDQNRLSAALAPFVTGAKTDGIPPEACLDLRDRRIDWVSCPPAAASGSASSPS